MGTISLHAVAIDELRDAFSGTDAAVARLRTIAASAWPQEPLPPKSTLLSKLGPLSRHQVGAPIIRPGIPTGGDVDDVAHGRDIPPDRRTAAWALVGAILDATSWGRLDVPADDRTIDQLDFTLAAAGLPARYGVRQWFLDAPGIPIKPLPGMTGGYVPHARVRAMASAWASAAEHSTPDAQPLAHTLTGWLAHWPQWTKNADEAGRPAPDLAVWFLPDQAINAPNTPSEK